MIKLKAYITYFGCTIILLLLITIFLKSDANISLYTLCLSAGVSSLVIGMNNQLDIKKLGFGLTRKYIFKQFIQDISIMVALTFVLIMFNVLFAYIVNSVYEIQYRLLIMTYLSSLTISMLGILFINIYKKKMFLIILISSIVFVIAMLWIIYNAIVINIILGLIIIGLYFLNRYLIYNADLYY